LPLNSSQERLKAGRERPAAKLVQQLIERMHTFIVLAGWDKALPYVPETAGSIYFLKLR
jgi:hypothetical protein